MIFKNPFKRNNLPELKHETKYAFTIGGVDYFQYVDFNNIPALRGLKTMVFFEEVKMKCTLDFLKLHVSAVDNILNGHKINLFEVKKLNDQLKQRLDMAIDLELVYKLASIVFFDKKENTQDYDFAYNLKKIQNWKKHAGTDFFLLMPVIELLPVLKSINENLQMYSQVVEQLNQVHLESLLRNLPGNRKATLTGKSYFTAVVMPQN